MVLAIIGSRAESKHFCNRYSVVEGLPRDYTYWRFLKGIKIINCVLATVIDGSPALHCETSYISFPEVPGGSSVVLLGVDLGFDLPSDPPAGGYLGAGAVLLGDQRIWVAANKALSCYPSAPYWFQGASCLFYPAAKVYPSIAPITRLRGREPVLFGPKSALCDTGFTLIAYSANGNRVQVHARLIYWVIPNSVLYWLMGFFAFRLFYSLTYYKEGDPDMIYWGGPATPGSVALPDGSTIIGGITPGVDTPKVEVPLDPAGGGYGDTPTIAAFDITKFGDTYDCVCSRGHTVTLSRRFLEGENAQERLVVYSAGEARQWVAPAEFNLIYPCDQYPSGAWFLKTYPPTSFVDECCLSYYTCQTLAELELRASLAKIPTDPPGTQIPWGTVWMWRPLHWANGAPLADGCGYWTYISQDGIPTSWTLKWPTPSGKLYPVDMTVPTNGGM